jgi:hypothetical protein
MGSLSYIHIRLWTTNIMLRQHSSVRFRMVYKEYYNHVQPLFALGLEETVDLKIGEFFTKKLIGEMPWTESHQDV